MNTQEVQAARDSIGGAMTGITAILQTLQLTDEALRAVAPAEAALAQLQADTEPLQAAYDNLIAINADLQTRINRATARAADAEAGAEAAEQAGRDRIAMAVATEQVAFDAEQEANARVTAAAAVAAPVVEPVPAVAGEPTQVDTAGNIIQFDPAPAEAAPVA